jgi:hypothetical protein
MNFKQLISVGIITILLFSFILSIRAEYSIRDEYIIDINASGDMELHLNFSVSPINTYYSSNTYYSRYNDWDMYEGSETAINKALDNEIDNEYEFRYVYSVYKLILWVFDPFIARIETLEKQHLDDQERIFRLEKRIYLLEKDVKNLTVS